MLHQIAVTIILFACRLDDEAARDDEFRAGGTRRSASHPDLYVVGQALYRDWTGLRRVSGITD